MMMSSHGEKDRPSRLPVAVQHEASNFTLAVVMAGIAAVFIAGIASAFIYAKDTSPAVTVQASHPSAAPHAPAETTGSGGASPVSPATPN